MQSEPEKSIKVLIVDNDTSQATVWKRLLAESGLEISQTTSVESLLEAFEAFNKNHFDVVLLELDLSDSQGLDTLIITSAKASESTIIVTATADEEFGLGILALGAQDYLKKGHCDVSTLNKTIRYAIERKRMEQLLRNEKDFRTKVIESIVNAVYVVDSNGKFRFVSRVGAQIGGYSTDELIDQPFSVLFRPEILPEFNEQFHKVAIDGQVITHVETELLHRDGRQVMVSMGLSPIFENNKLVSTVWTAEDITERKRLFEILDRKQKNLEAIFDAAPVGMLLIDENKIVKRVNDAVRQMVKRGFVEIINQDIGGALGCIHNVRNENKCQRSRFCENCPFPKTIENVLDSDQPVHELQVRPALLIENKEVMPYLSISAEPVIIDGRKHAVIAIDDISIRKEAEEKLKETMALKAQFISTVSHELRTPLACMREGVTIVLDGTAGKINDEQKNFLNIAKRNIDRLTVLINDVLDFQKFNAGKMTLNIQENDMEEIAKEVHETMALSAKKNDISLTLESADKLPLIKCDKDKIIQVLTNLINNAIKFTPSKGHVTVRLEQQNNELLLRVIDTGMGIPKESLPKILDRFYRVNRPGKEIQGTGLGLAIVNKIVKLHKGRIEIESELDQGTTVTVSLPLVSEPTPEPLSEEADDFLEKTLV